MQIQITSFKEGIICFPNLINHEPFLTGPLIGQVVQQNALGDPQPTYFAFFSYMLES